VQHLPTKLKVLVKDETALNMRELEELPKGWVDDELLYYYDRFYVPQAVRIEILLRRLHDTLLAGHLEQKRTLELIQRKFQILLAEGENRY
jgi:hypothetical protein